MKCGGVASTTTTLMRTRDKHKQLNSIFQNNAWFGKEML